MENLNDKYKNNLKIQCEIYSRVSGFYRPLQQFNPGKKEEFKNRRNLVLNEIQLMSNAYDSNQK